MTIELYLHPLSPFCWKVLIALYENETPFQPTVVDLGDERSRADFLRVWPLGKFPVLRDRVSEALVPESTSIIEYLAQVHPGKVAFLPRDAELPLSTTRTAFFLLPRATRTSAPTFAGSKSGPPSRACAKRRSRTPRCSRDEATARHREGRGCRGFACDAGSNAGRGWIDGDRTRRSGRTM